MPIKPKITQIKKNLEEYLKLKHEVLSFSGPNIQAFPNYNPDEISTIVEDTNRILNYVNDNPEILESLNFTYLNNFDKCPNTPAKDFTDSAPRPGQS